MSDKPIAAVTGVGPGTGAAIVRKFAAEGFRVVMLARSRDVTGPLEQELADCHALICDVSEEAQVAAAAAEIAARWGHPGVVAHNAVAGGFGGFLDIDPALLQRNFQVNVMGLLHVARAFAPAMIERGEGSILVTGNTSALRGRPGFAGFAPSKAAQRILAEAMARDLGPKGVHVAYLVIDAVIDVPWTRARYPEAPDAFFARPAALADEIWRLHKQDRSAWTFLAEVRPFGETW